MRFFKIDKVSTVSGEKKDGVKLRKKHWSLIILGLFLLLFGASFAIYAFQNSKTSNQNGKPAGIILGFFIIAALLATAIYLIYRFIKFIIHHRWWGVTILVILGLIISMGISIHNRPNYQKSIAVLPDIQDSLTQIAAAKLLGDSITAKKSVAGATMDKVNTDETAVAKKLSDLSVLPLLKDYQQSAIDWANQIAVSAQIPEIWQSLPGQPGDFPLALSDSQAEQLFQESVRKIAGLKQDGHTATQKKDRETMRLVAAKLMVEQHWLNGLLHSQSTGALSSQLIAPVLASNQNPADVPPVGPSEDVTCRVCADPKVHWTTLLRKQYGCEIRCNPSKQTTEQQTTEQQTEQTQTKQEQDQEKPYSYKDAPPRKICIGRGGVSTGNSATNMYCVEEAISSTNEIAASAIGFAVEGKGITVSTWDNQFAEIEKNLPTEENSAGQAPSTPTAAGGHKEGGMGTIQQGKPIATPEPTQQNKGGIWDGYYETSGTCVDHCTGQGLCVEIQCNGAGTCSSIIPPDKYTNENRGFSVYNNQLQSYGSDKGYIGASGYAKTNISPEFGWYEEFQFTKTASGVSVKIKSYTTTLVLGGSELTCTYSGMRQSD